MAKTSKMLLLLASTSIIFQLGKTTRSDVDDEPAEEQDPLSVETSELEQALEKRRNLAAPEKVYESLTAPSNAADASAERAIHEIQVSEESPTELQVLFNEIDRQSKEGKSDGTISFGEWFAYFRKQLSDSDTSNKDLEQIRCMFRQADGMQKDDSKITIDEFKKWFLESWDSKCGTGDPGATNGDVLFRIKNMPSLKDQVKKAEDRIVVDILDFILKKDKELNFGQLSLDFARQVKQGTTLRINDELLQALFKAWAETCGACMPGPCGAVDKACAENFKTEFVSILNSTRQ